MTSFFLLNKHYLEKVTHLLLLLFFVKHVFKGNLRLLANQLT